jgi:pimeloyl-ACP methyl ester carboxylesterase
VTSRTISVFAREVVAAEKQGADLPTLVFFQGGPGGAAPRPETRSGWLGKALEGHRVLLLDQRGTGLSTPVTSETLPVEGDGAAQAAYLAHFRADAIVEDAEAIRRALLGRPPLARARPELRRVRPCCATSPPCPMGSRPR